MNQEPLDFSCSEDSQGEGRATKVRGGKAAGPAAKCVLSPSPVPRSNSSQQLHSSGEVTSLGCRLQYLGGQRPPVPRNILCWLFIPPWVLGDYGGDTNCAHVDKGPGSVPETLPMLSDLLHYIAQAHGSVHRLWPELLQS